MFVLAGTSEGTRESKSSSGNRCLRCGLGELVGLRCVVLAGTSEGTRESKEFKCELAL